MASELQHACLELLTALLWYDGDIVPVEGGQQAHEDQASQKACVWCMDLRVCVISLVIYLPQNIISRVCLRPLAIL